MRSLVSCCCFRVRFRVRDPPSCSSSVSVLHFLFDRIAWGRFGMLRSHWSVCAIMTTRVHALAAGARVANVSLS